MSKELAIGSPDLWVILPTYCEAENIRLVIEKLLTQEMDLNIVVVDDNSPDGTSEIVRSLAATDRNVWLLQREAKEGLGAAYLAGFQYALDRGADPVVTMDCDLSHDPTSVAAIVDGLSSAGCAVGSRYVEGGKIVNWPFHRRMLSATANWFVRRLFAMPVRDCTSGFRAYKRAVIEDILAVGPRSQGYSFLVEALWIAAAGGLPIVESPICFVERVRGTSKMGFREIVFGVRSLLLLRLKGSGPPKGRIERLNDRNESGLDTV